VIVWDRGHYQNTKEDKSFEESLKDGHNIIKIHGDKLKGKFALIRTEKDITHDGFS